MQMQAMGSSEERKKYGDYLRAVREGLGLERDAFARRIGVSARTLGNCENGQQALGRAAKRAVETLVDPAARFGPQVDMQETSGSYGLKADADAKTVARLVARIASDQEMQRKANAVAKAMGVTYERAVEIVVREMIESGQ